MKRSVGLVSVVLIVVSALLQLSASASQQVTLAWQSSNDPTITGYRVYYGVASGSYSMMVSVTNTSATISGLQEGATYYFVVTDYDNTGLESVPSNEVSYTVPAVTLSLGRIQTAGSANAFSITSAGSTLSPWVLEASRDLKTWGELTTGTNTAAVAVAIVPPSPAIYFRLNSGSPGVVLSMQRRQPNGFPNSYVITAPDATPWQWTLEVCTDAKTWSTLARGTNSPVNVAVIASATPVTSMFFRLRGP